MKHRSNQKRERNRPKTPTAPCESLLNFDVPPPSYDEVCSDETFYHPPSANGTTSNEFPPPHYESIEDGSRKSFKRTRGIPIQTDFPQSRNSSSNSSSTINNEHLSMHSHLQTLHSNCSTKELEDSLVPGLSEEDLLNAFKQFRKRYACFFHSHKDLPKVINIDKTAIWKYSIDTRIENRHLSTEEEPYYGPVVKERQLSFVSAWDIDIYIPNKNGSKKFKLPGTSVIATCKRCLGRKSIACTACSGSGDIPCRECWGTGTRRVVRITSQHELNETRNCSTRHSQNLETCSLCYGRGKRQCFTCDGSSCVDCPKCKNMGKVEKFEQLFVEWKTLSNYGYSEEFCFPSNFIDRCKGIDVYENQVLNDLLVPISSKECLQTDIKRFSNEYIQLHQRLSGSFHISKQSHSISVIPIYEVTCERNSKIKKMWVVGTNHNIYCKHCCSKPCTII